MKHEFYHCEVVMKSFMFWKSMTERATYILLRRPALKKSLVAEVYHSFLMVPFHSSFHLSISVVQTDTSHNTISSSHGFRCTTFFLFWQHPFPKGEKSILTKFENFPVLTTIRHQKYFNFRLDGKSLCK